MANYYHTVTQRVVGQASDRVRVRDFYAVSRPGGTVSAVQGQVLGDSMVLARRRLDEVLSLTRDSRRALRGGSDMDLSVDFLENLKSLFRVAGDASAATIRNTIETAYDSLSRVQHGLGTRDIQIVDSNPNRGGVASGYVRMAYREILRRRDAERQVSFGGRVHFRFALLRAGDESKVAHVIIHEAAHKFAGARDWCYLPSESGMVAMENDMRGIGVPSQGAWYDMTNIQALNNADSYAGFVMQMPARL